MSRIFLSHSSRDWRQAVALKQWLAEQDNTLATEIFLDIDLETGIPTGVRWREALQQASHRCQAVICLMSPHWAASPECRLEYDTAMELHKQMFCARLRPSAADELTAQWQRCDLFGDGPTTTVDIGDGGEPVVFASHGLARLLKGIRGSGLGAESFRWPPAEDPDRAPYRGWEPLSESDAAVFFGRDAEIVLGLDAIRGIRAAGMKNLFVVLGPSGAGKSSFLRAGLVPRLRRDDRAFLVLDIVRPQQAVLTGESGLAQSIYATRSRLGLAGRSAGEIAGQLGDAHRVRELLAECQRQAQRGLLDDEPSTTPPTVVLPLDQAEELFTADAGPEAHRFLDLVAALATGPASMSLIVAATIRTDRYEAMQTAPELAGVHTETFNDLKPMDVAHFKEVILGPAARAGTAGQQLSVEPALVEELLEECSGGADTLPFLALTLARLYARRDGSGRLTLARYRDMGGMRNVVQSEVDEVLSTDPARRAEQLGWLRAAFIPWLATINPDNEQPMRRFARYRDLPPQSRPLIDALVAKRLLVKDSRGPDTVVEVALESLLRQWDDLAGWLREQQHNLMAADELERMAAGWRANDHNPAWLLEGSRLADAGTLVNTDGFQRRLAGTHDFLDASHLREQQRIAAEQEHQRALLQAAEERARHAQEQQATAEAHAAVLHRRSQVLRRTLVATALAAVIALVGGVTAAVGFRQASAARDEAQQQLRTTTVGKLVSEAKSILDGGAAGTDQEAIEKTLAAYRIALADNDSPDPGAILDALAATASTTRIIDTPGAPGGAGFSADGAMVARSADDNTVRRYDTATGAQIGEPMQGHTDTVFTIAVSPDGKMIASGGLDRSLRLWDAGTGAPIREARTGHGDAILHVTFSPDSRTVATASRDGTVGLWNVASGALVRSLAGHTDYVHDVAFSPDGRLLATAGNDGTVRLWDATTGAPGGELTGYSQGVYSVAFSPDGRRLATGSGDGNFDVWMWDLTTKQPIATDVGGQNNSISGLAFTADGTRLLSASLDQTIVVRDGYTGAPQCHPMQGHDDRVLRGITVTADGVWSAGADATVRLWDFRNICAAAAPGMWTAAFDLDHHTVFTSGKEDSIHAWNLDTGARQDPFPLGAHEDISAVAVSPDGTRLATTGGGALRLWDVRTRREVVPPLLTGADVNSVAFTPDGRRLVAGGHHVLTIWDVRTGRLLRDVPGNELRILAVAISPDGNRIATAVADDTIRLWNTADLDQPGEPLKGHGEFIFTVRFSPDGKTLASGSLDQTVRLWDVDTHEQVGELHGHTDAVMSLAFSPDGKTLASGGNDASVRLWDLAAGRQIGSPMSANSNFVAALQFSDDGSVVWAADADGTVRTWPAVADPAALCAKLTSPMSTEEWDAWVGPGIPQIELCPGGPAR